MYIYVFFKRLSFVLDIALVRYNYLKFHLISGDRSFTFQRDFYYAVHFVRVKQLLLYRLFRTPYLKVQVLITFNCSTRCLLYTIWTKQRFSIYVEISLLIQRVIGNTRKRAVFAISPSPEKIVSSRLNAPYAKIALHRSQKTRHDETKKKIKRPVK